MCEVLSPAGLVLVLLAVRVGAESAVLRFRGQTRFRVEESSRSVVRLQVERVGVPVNVTALVLLEGEDTGDFEATTAAAFLQSTETSKTIFIAIRDDDLPEADETFVFTLRLQSSSNGVTLGTPNTATITILSNDNAFGIISFNSSALITVDEPKGKNQYLPLSLIRERGTYGTVTVKFEVFGGPNPAIEDLSPDRGNITIPPGRAVVVYSLLIQDDQLPEDDEIFTVQLTGVAGGALLNPNRSSVQIRIRRNDAPVRFSGPSLAVAENAGVLALNVSRGRTESGILVGSDDAEVSVNYTIVTGDGPAGATPSEDFADLQTSRTVVFPPGVHEMQLHFNISDDDVPEIAESFQVVLLEETLRGDAVLVSPSVMQVTIEPNDKPYGVLSISSPSPPKPIIINEDQTVRFEGIFVVRNGGTHGDVSVNWTITRNSSDPSPVSDDLVPSSGVLRMTAGQMRAALPLNITQDALPEEAEAFLLRLLPDSVQGGAEVDEPMGMVFYIQDSDDVYGRFAFHPEERQSIQSQPEGRFLSLSFLRDGGTLGEVRLDLTALYIPAGPLDLTRARDGILNGSSTNTLRFSSGQSRTQLILPIRNDAFLQNGAHFVIRLDSVQLVSIIPLVLSMSPRFGGAVNLSLTVTPDIANGEIGFTSNRTVVALEPEDGNSTTITLPLKRDGTDGQAQVFWSLRPFGENRVDVTSDDLSPFSGSVTFLSGQSEAEINIAVLADDVPEINESLALTLDRVETARFVVYFGTNVDNQILKQGFTSREIVILENDDPGGVFEFSPVSKGPWIINEGETVELRVVRAQGQLLKQLVRYTVMPAGNAQFYGATGILEFQPGEREVVVALVARPDGVPELEETYSVILSSYSTPASRLGNRRQVNITVRQSDDPFGVIEFAHPAMDFAINESKGVTTHSASYPILRSRGRFGNVSVSWVLEPAHSGDVTPVQGEVLFSEGEFLKNLTLFSQPDEIPEELETFTISLLNATGGARLGNVLNASLQITENDDPIYFAEPAVVRVQEGGVANFTVLRAGLANFVATVMYRFDYGSASPEDIAPLGNSSLLVFEVGQWMKNISVAVDDDDVPETDEPFYIVLFNATGDAVVYGQGTATVVIEANDDANGIFSLEPTEKAVLEGKSNNFYVRRDRGHFGNVTVFWQLFANDTPLEPSQEFFNTSGSIEFTTGMETKPIVLEAISDKLPEFIEFYELRLVNISGGHPGEGGRLATRNLNTSVLIPFNDDPFGVFAIDRDSLVREVAEDVLSEDDASDITSFTILRQQGTFGVVRVAWEILSGAFPNGLPPMLDLILMATFPRGVVPRPHSRRYHSGTDALSFSGRPGSYGTVSVDDQPGDGPSTLANFTISAWLMPKPNTEGFVFSKGNGNGSLQYGVKVLINESHVTTMLYYTAAGSNNAQAARSTAAKFVEENVWVHVVVAVEDGIIEFYLDGNPVPGGVKSLKGEAIVNEAAPILIGSDPDGRQLFTGLLQDVRLYPGSRLDHAQIHELHVRPAKADLRNVSGYLEYRQDERSKSFVVEVRDDRQEEGEEEFYLQLVVVHGGARLPMPRPTAILRVMKSDNANGLFAFTGACIPDIAEEGSTISCVVERTRGALDYVSVNYAVVQTDPTGVASNMSDFANATGSILFPPGHRSEVLNLLALDDDIPELDENFQIVLVSAISADGKPGSTPTSGASIDPNNAVTTVTIKASDHPYGLLQFQTSPLIAEVIRPAVKEARVTVREEAGVARLLVTRAQGLLGRVMVGYRTTPFTASSPEDYEDADGLLDFLPGERFKYINVTIVDNPVPELDKIFRVELYNPSGGVEPFFERELSGSGEGDSESFLPSFHHHASLGLAYRITVTIGASDEAHGVFRFGGDSLAVNGTEPDEGRSSVTLQVIRTFGDLSNVTLYWEADPDSEGELEYRSGNLTFAVGQRVGNIVLQVSQDDIPELDKSFKIILTNVSNGRLGNQTVAVITVLANDDPYGLFLFPDSSRPIRVPESDSLVTLTIQRRGGLMGIVRVTFGTLRDSDAPPYGTPGVGIASEGRDFVPVRQTVTFSANQSEANVTLRVLDDQEPERAESVFVRLLSISLAQGEQSRPVALSPRLGVGNESVAQVIIAASDDAFGVLQLSSPAVSVAEHYTGPIINVTRTGGIFADVSVKFRAVPMTARVGEDYSVASSDVVLLEGESSKPVPILIINDRLPELEETFRIELLNQTTGGALLGPITQAVITILPSDDPYGSFVFQAEHVTVEEPGINAFEVSLPIVRNAGTIGRVSIQWRATVNGRPATGDLRPLSGEVTFAAGETMKTLKVEVLADDVPEIEEVIKVELTGATNGGSIGSDNVVNIIVPANDNPHGSVYFERAVYRVQEPLEGVYTTNITVRRSGGHFGQLEILYSTAEIDVVSIAQQAGQDFLIFYDPPVTGGLPAPQRQPLNITSSADPRNDCAASCLRQPLCQAFSYTAVPMPTCFWATAGPSQLASAPGTLTYRKNSTAAVSLFSSQAVAGSDYTTVTAQAVIVPDGAAVANLTVPILSDSLPEVDESFSVRILRVGLVNASAAEKNKPTVGQPDVALVTIGMNGDAFGVFSLYSVSPNATDGGLYLEVREEPQTRVLLVVERMGGSLGQVTVEWKYVGGNATPNADFNGTGETLVFAEGDVKKTIEFFIADDTEPEANETLRIGLVRTEGGSRILPSSDTVTVLILANDNAAGVLGFGASSRSAIAREGESVALLVERTAPAVGNVTVEWGVRGPRPTLTFADTSGMLFFSEGMLNDTVVLQLLDDSTPEEREEYRITLSNVKTEGVTVTGMARLDPQGLEAVVTVEASDEPFGMLSIPPSSLRLTTAERDITIRIYINREFGASGAVNISYETVRGSLEDLAPTQTALAEPGQDFLHVSGSVVLQDGQTSVSVPITIMDDDIPELREVFLVNVTSAVVVTTLSTAPTLGSSNPVDVYYTLKDTQGLVAQVSIEANDGVQGIIGWQSVNFEVNETVGVVTLMAYRNAGTYGNVSLFFYAQNLEAQLGFDYNVTPAMLHFVDGERYKFVEVEVLDDAQPEGDERFQLILTNPSAGLELGENITATVTILTNDDGRGVISFNTSEHFLLMEPTSVSGLGQSMATLYVVRDPPQGTFGTVSVQFSVTDSNGSRHTSDLSPSEGFVVLEDGVRFKTLEIWAVLDEEPEMNETFTVTLFDPLGGARLGRPVQTFITVLQNQAPLGLFRITASRNRTDTLMVEENAGTVFLTVSRSNGLDSAVSVEWETQSDTAFGMKGEQAALVVYQALGGTETLGWCVVPSTDPPMALRLQQGRPGSASPGLATPYTWQGVLGPLQPVAVDSPSRCVGFAVNGSSYVAVTHGVSAVTRHANLSLYRLQPDLNLTLVQTLTVADPNIKQFSADAQQYLVASTQVFKWVEDSLSLHQTLDLQDVSAVSPISRGNSNKRHLVVCQTRATSGCLVYLWSGGSFQNPQPLDIEARVTQAESFDVGGESVLFLLTEGPSPICEVFLWGAKQSAFQQTQSIPFPGLSSIHPFMPPSGILHVMLAGQRGSALFAWRSDQRLFSEALKSAPAGHFLFLPVPSFNDTKSLMATSGPQGPQGTIVYELTSMFNQSDFIPSSGELRFTEGVKELEIAVNIVDDDLPEEEERFRVVLKNPKGGAEIGFGGQVTVIIPANDDTYGVIGFTQNSLLREVEELREDNIISLSVERKRGMFGRLTVHWTAHGNTEDIFPTSGVVSFSPGQAIASISLSVLSDGVPELDETVAVVLTKVTTVGIADLVRGAVIDPFRSRANLTIRANGSPYGVIGWHLDSQYYITPEPQRSPSNITLSIIRDQGSSGDIIVYYTTLPALAQPPVNQATAGQDYIAKESTVVMMEDATVALVTITILPDEVPELAESFLVNLTRVELSGTVTGAGQPSLRRPGLEVAEVTIQESDDPRGVLQLNVSQDTVLAYEVPPPGNLLRLPVVRLAGSVGRVAVYWEAQPITASFDDFSPAQGNLTFSDEQSLGVIEITITDDTLVESVETFLVRLTHVIGGARLGTAISVTISIPPNDSPLGRFGFESLTVTVTEPQFEGDPAAVATLVVVRRGGDGGTVHLIWLLQAEGADDLEPHNGTLVFEGAEARKSLEVYAVADSVLEGEERFTIQLLSARNEPVIDPVRDVVTVVIEANRGALGSTGIAESSRNILIGEPEGSYNGTALISLVRGPGIFGEIQIYWNITPAMDTEFERTAGIVTMRDQQSAATILLRALDDDVPELRRDYQLTLTSMTPGSEVSPNRKVATVTMVASDHPYGVFSFSQSSLRVSEEDKMVNVTVVRGSGLFGSVWVSYRTEAGTALGGEDFQRASGRLLFRAGVSSLPLALELLDDALPEGPETFRINITHVELLNDSADSTLREGGLQLDQPPATGSLSSITLVILPSDNAQGILEFHPDYVNITVDEDVGTVSIPVVRRVGSYGSVSADVISRGLTAKPGDDYFLSNASVHFLDRQNLSYINVSIVDDLDREYSETFELRLSAPTGGATLGAHLVARVTIAKSDSPNGVVRFVNDTSIVIANPDSTLLMTLILERAGGFVGNATITWNILGPNSKEVLPSVNADFGEPVSGSFRLGDGEEGRHVVELQILPHKEVEVAETFVVGLSVLEGDVDIDPKAGSVTITVEKFGDPNGIVQFAEQDLAERVYSEPSDSDGPLAITLLIMRREGVMGNITVFWEIQSESDATGDFSASRGSVAMAAGQRVAELQLSLLPDGVPELEELYAVRLIAADGGAELDADRAEARLRVRANDEPHGAFLLRAERQALEVAADDGARSLILNVSRMAGGFGDVDVRYRVRYGLAGDAAVGSVLVRDGERSASVAVAISSQLFLEVGSNFTVELTNVSLIGPLLSSPPRILLDSKSAVVSVPEAAANAEVGFDSLALQVASIESGQCEALLSRRGLYGNVTVEWAAGFPPGQAPPGYRPGDATPSFGAVVLAHGQASASVPFAAVLDPSEPTAHAIHLTSARSRWPGGARIRPGFSVAEVEPLGVYLFSADSQQLVVQEDEQTVTLYIQRFYGFRSNVSQLSYTTWPGSARPGEDFVAVSDGQVLFEPRQTSAPIQVSVLDDTLTEPDENFYVNLTSVKDLGTAPPSTSARPRIAPEGSVASVTILANDAASGFLSVGPSLVRVTEDRQEGAPDQRVALRVRRTAGLSGTVRVRVHSYTGGLQIPGTTEQFPFLREENGTWASEGEDFSLEVQTVTLQEGQSEAEVLLQVLDDEEPEGEEVLYVYLGEVQGGAQVVGAPDQHGFTGYAKIIILGSDVQNGFVGFSVLSQTGQTLDEDSDNRTAVLFLLRQENRAFEDVEVYWRVTFSTTGQSLASNGVNLTTELLQTAGRSLCRRGEVICEVSLEVRADQEPEFPVWFLVEIYQVGSGAAINQSARFANVTMLESDDPRGLVYFAVGSRLPSATLKTTRLTLQVYRLASVSTAMTVRYRTVELQKAQSVGPTLIWPAVAGKDFVAAEGVLTFDPGQRSAGLDVVLTPDTGSSNPAPKRFRVALTEASGGVRVHPRFGLAEVTLVTDAPAQAVWAALDQLQQPLDETIINGVLENLLNKASGDVSREQLTAVLEALNKVLTEAEQTPLMDSSRGLTYDLLCALANPNRADTRGLSQLAEVTERFAFSLLTDAGCGAEGQRGRTILDSCPHFSISAFRWYPSQINGHAFAGSNGDSFSLPERLLEVPVGALDPGVCRNVHFTQYSTEHWFLTQSHGSALNDKVFSVSVQGRGSRPLSDGGEVLYRIHTPNRRVKPRQAVCLLWNQAAESWLSDEQFCRVLEDGQGYVECACRHLSVYTASAETDAAAAYNRAFYAAGFICISGFALAVVSHVVCARFPMFAAKLLTHMMVACLGTQICFLVSAFRGRMLSEDGCATLGLFSHYFHLCQFTWMLTQAVNFWQTLVMNDEHTDRRYLLYFLLSWGLPALVIAVLVIVLLGGYGWSIHSVYGLVQGDICFIPNVYAALCTAVLVPLICLVGVVVVFIHAYQVTQQWKAYDDLYRGRTNSSEVPMVLYLFALVSVVWLWAGLHMAYRFLWLLILLVIFNILLGLYVFAVYFIMHNPLCWPAKASYTVEMNGHGSPDGVFQGVGAATVGGEISKSTQNLISAMEEVSADWERTSLRASSQPSSVFKPAPQNGSYSPEGGFINTTLAPDEDSQEFDDLIFALKTGSGLNISDTESTHGSHDGGGVANSQIVELRRIPIADTHL